ncbi:neuropeptide-like 1 isoform X2 [Halyomorpha halys]|uniref:neuropeptide-like 1 isoform X2 n=1 Tax=Halyomorpha halys TaxID=286706 RepID=UPI0034D3709B
MTTTLCALALAVFLVQVRGDVEKRSITAVRSGQPTEKRYIAALAKNGDYPRLAWNKKYHSLEDIPFGQDPIEDNKRYLGALARTGDLRVAREREDKRDDVDSLIRDIASADDLRRLRLEALREELMKERDDEPEQDDDTDNDKRSLASIARAGGIPGKRSVEALARIGLLKPITTTHDFTEDLNDYEKKISSDEFEDEKRGGISSLARNGYYNNKRTVDEELEELMNEVYGIGEKRNVASLARGFNLPQNGKRSEEIEDKRNLQSIMRDRGGKRDGYTNNAIPFVNNDKRNVGALAKNRDFPYAYRFGKREVSEVENDEMSKRYVATLLRDGRLPIGPDATPEHETTNLKDDNSANEGKESTSQITEDKNQSVRRKKDISEVEKEENHTRSKRETFIAPIAGEVAVPPSGDLHFGGMLTDNRWADESSPLNKRFFGVDTWISPEKRHIGALARGGWLPRAYLRSGRQPSGEGRWQDAWWSTA